MVELTLWPASQSSAATAFYQVFNSSGVTSSSSSFYHFLAFALPKRELIFHYLQSLQTGKQREREQMGLLTNRVERNEIKAGDHIYTYRAVFAYSHHGIFYLFLSRLLFVCLFVLAYRLRFSLIFLEFCNVGSSFNTHSFVFAFKIFFPCI